MSSPLSRRLYEDRESIPNMRIVWGHKLPMRHFHAFLEPYANEESNSGKYN